MKEELSRRDLLKLLNALNKKLKIQNKNGELYLVGGAVMCLVLNARKSTRDIDALFEPSQVTRKIAKEIALEKDINTNWLNDGVKGFLSEKSEFNSYLELSNLKILTASPSYLLAMKCLATHDVDDIRFLIRYLNLESCEEIFGILDQYYPLKRYPQKTVYFLEGLFE